MVYLLVPHLLVLERRIKYLLKSRAATNDKPTDDFSD